MNFLDVLYTPIDLPPCPVIDVKKLRKWVDESYPRQKDLIDMTAGDVQSHNQLKNNYPWNFTFAKFFDWQQGFEEQFPELVDYINNIYKIQDTQLDIVAILPVRDKPSKIKFWHTDPDKFGLRFYVTNDRYKENPILIKKGLPGIPDEDMRGKIFEETDSRLVNDLVYRANIVHPRQPFYLNNFKAAHAVEFNKEGDRIAVLLGVSNMMYDSAEFTEQMNTLITQSALKYHKDAVFLHDWSDSITRDSQ
jgi:hypothetical protein